MKQLFIVAVMLFVASHLYATEIIKDFQPSDIPSAWQLSKDEDPDNIVAWGDIEEKGLLVNSEVAGYYPWVTSMAQFGNVSKVEIEVYSDYSRLSISEVKVGNVYLTPASEYGYDENPEKSFVFLSDSETKPIGSISIAFSDISRNSLYLKSIKVTFNPNGVDRELKWSVSNLNVNLGEAFENPTLSGESSGVTFMSSNEEVAIINPMGVVTPLSVGKTTITASCPEDYPWAAAESSYNLEVSFNLDGNGTYESVTLSQPGTLKETVMELESVKIRSIKVSGPINAADIAYLRETTGRFSNLQEIDLSDANLVADNMQYATLGGKNHDVGMGYDQYVFILSDDMHVEEKTESTGLGGGVRTYTFFDNQLAGAFNSLTNLKRLVLPSSISEVSPFIAYGCTSLVDIILPENYTEIGQGAFGECSSLSSIPTSAYCDNVAEAAFYNSGLAVFDFSGIKCIGKEGFRNTKLSGTLNLSNIHSIDERAFYDTNDITDVAFGNNLKSIGNAALRLTGLKGKLMLPNGCESIGDEAFADTEISEIEIPETCLNIGMNPFDRTPWYDNAKLSAKADEVIYLNHIALAYKTDAAAHSSEDWTLSLAFREGTLTVADGFAYYFYDYGNDKITSVTLPSTLKWIGNKAFYNVLRNTEQIIFPDALEHIGSEAFYYCGVGSVTLGSNISAIGEYAFGFCDGLVKVNYNVPNATGSFIFSSCKGLEMVKFGAEVQSIPDFAFAYCSALVKYEFENLTLPQNARVASLTSNDNGFTIGESVFAECSNLTSAVLPFNITYVGEHAFEETSLKTIYCFAYTPIDIDSSDIFSNGKNTTIYVPQENEAAYEADPNWSKCNIVGTDMSASIEDIYAEFDEQSIVKVFTLHGTEIYEGQFSSINVPAGIYIVVSKDKTFKIKI